ncbi:hypothetical protein LIER_26970 [Lithospermum erythrorhizon]|uniref:SWIM-type domain-containing protein n=1 Tax=Lithospermum erythrorhizon TaxID=34254 RepID=A0AAV3RE15_LITER
MCIVKTIDTGDGNKRFHRIYICWAACKEGFKSGCRKIIGVDGCHLKGKYGGQLLVAIEIDANNNIYPLAYAVVEVENKSSWEWFLEYVYWDVKDSDDPDEAIQEQYTWTFMSDKQKGLIEAFKTVMPNVDHRFCVRHLHGNFKRAVFNAQAFEDVLWLAATSTTIQFFKHPMEKMKKLDPNAFDWFKDKCPTTWSRAYFSSTVKCDILLNNLCECFNAFILDARDKPILTLLSMIEDLIMVRMQMNRNKVEAGEGKICPKVRLKLRKNVDESVGYIPVQSDKNHFQVYTGYYQFQSAMDLIKGTCSCNRWQLSGIACKHACCAIRMNPGDDIEDYVHSSYTVETYRRSYAPIIMPMSGREFWPQTNPSLLPPMYRGKKRGRPKRMRRVDPHEN